MKKEKKVEMRGTDQSRKSKKGVAGIGVEFLPHTTFPFCSQHPQKRPVPIITSTPNPTSPSFPSLSPLN